MRRRIRPRIALAIAAILIFSGAGVLALAADASASATLNVFPSTGLTDGQSVTVSGTGFVASSTGAIVECSDAAGQPTVTVAGNAVPVSCTNPLLHIKSTDGSGTLAASSFTVHEGVVGPPGTGTDSGGGSASTDAANYPCPPTTAQQSAGASCTVSFGDQGGDEQSQNISFASGGGTTTTTTTTTASTTTTTTSSSSSTTTTTAGTTTTTAPCNATSTTSSGSPSLTADPGTCLNGGSKVTVTGSGFDDGSTGTVLECNNDPGQPTVALPAPVSQSVPVSCSGINVNDLVTVSGTGGISTTVTIVSPTPGPPCGSAYLISTCPSTDSGGGDPTTDAAKYPCPPTAAQIAAGDTCTLSFGDSGGKQGTVPISFVPAPTAGGSSGTTTTTVAAAAAHNSSTSPSSAASSGTLAFTGPGPGLWVLAIGGILLIDLGFLILTLYYSPAELLVLARRRVHRLFGGGV